MKRLLSLLLTVCLVLSSVPAAAVKSPDEAKLLAGGLVPGVNFFSYGNSLETFTSKPAWWIGSQFSSYLLEGESRSYVDQVAGRGTVMRFSWDKGRDGMIFAAFYPNDVNGVAIEDDRPLYAGFLGRSSGSNYLKFGNGYDNGGAWINDGGDVSYTYANNCLYVDSTDWQYYHTSFTKYAESEKIVWFRLSVGAADQNTPQWLEIDDFVVAPYYKINYTLNGASYAHAYASPVDDLTGAYLTETPLSLVKEPYKIGYRFTGWSLDGVHVVETAPLMNEDITVYAVFEESGDEPYDDEFPSYASAGDPGVNLITGDNTPFDYESTAVGGNGAPCDFGVWAGASAEVSLDPFDSGNKVMHVKGGIAYSGGQLWVNFGALTADPDRPVQVVTRTVSTDKALLRYFDEVNNDLVPYYHVEQNWAAHSVLLYPTVDRFQFAFVTEVDTENDLYMDDMIAAPAYRFTYRTEDGVFATAYVAGYADDGERLRWAAAAQTADLPRKSGLLFAGWSLDGSTVTETVPLQYRDVDLYAVFKTPGGEDLESASPETPAGAKPGDPAVNILTGTRLAYGYERGTVGGSDPVAFFLGHNDTPTSVILDPADTSNKILRAIPPIEGAGASFYASFGTLAEDATRPVTLAVKARVGESGARGMFRILDAAGGDQLMDDQNLTAAWKTYQTSVLPTVSERFIFHLRGLVGRPTPLDVDDVYIAPHYRFTYHVGGAEYAVAYVSPLAESGLYRTVAAVRQIDDPVRPGYTFLGWSLDENGTEIDDYVTLNCKDLDFYAVWGYDGSLPGVNILTGDRTALDFENGEKGIVGFAHAAVVNDGNGGKVLAVSQTDDWYVYVHRENCSLYTGGRPVTVSFRYAESQENAASFMQVIGNTAWEGTTSFSPSVSFKTAKVVADTTGLDEATDPSFILYVVESGGTVAYLDDIILTPHYLVTYYVDGKAFETQTVDPVGDDGAFRSSFVPDAVAPEKRGYAFLGWALSPLAESAVQSVPLANEDIALYAVYAFDETYFLGDGTATPFDETPEGAYGRLLYRNDFDGEDSIKNYEYDPAYESPYALSGASLANPATVTLRDGDGSAPRITLEPDPVSGVGDSLAMLGRSQYPLLRLSFADRALSKPGRYHFLFKSYKGAEKLNPIVRLYMNDATAVPNITLNSSAKTFAENDLRFTVVTREEFENSGVADASYTLDNVCSLDHIDLFLENGSGKTIRFDDFELWFEEYADITFRLDGLSNAVRTRITQALPALHASFKPGSRVPSPDLAGIGYRFIGWATDPAGEQIRMTAKAGRYDLYPIVAEAGGETPLPDDTVSVGEAVYGVSRLYAAFSGEAFPATDAATLSYALNEGLIDESLAQEPARAILRHEAAAILAATLPEETLTALSVIGEIPDVAETDAYYDAVKALYACGILTGRTASGSFDPYDTLKKYEWTVMLDRAMIPERRAVNDLRPTHGGKMLLDSEEKEISASFITLPDAYIGSLETYPDATLPMGEWIWGNYNTRVYLRYNFSAVKTVEKAEMEFQCDNAMDLFINGARYESAKKDGWYVTGNVDITDAVQKGANFIGIRCFHTDTPLRFSSALRGCVRLRYTDGSVENIPTDSSWRWKFYVVSPFYTNTEPEEWYFADTLMTHLPLMYNTDGLHPRALRRSGYFRKEFESSGTVTSAVLIAAAKGLYIPYINGRRVGDDMFISGSMMKYSEYQVFDVTDMIASGDNVLAAVTGNGWYNSENVSNMYWNKPLLMMQLVITYADGSTKTVKTDGTWKATASPLTDNDIQFGERYDARLEIAGWNEVGSPDGTWVNAAVADQTVSPFKRQNYPAVKGKELRAERIGAFADGTVYYDFGTNSAGRVKLTLRDTNEGDVIIVRYAEDISAEENLPYTEVYGSVYFTDDTQDGGRAYWSARNTDVYICKGAEEEVFAPEFTYTGFRYIYVYGYNGKFTLDTVRKVEMTTGVADIGDIETSHADIAALWDAVKRSYRSNILSGPTDCPTREKNFWNGDIQVFAHTACWFTDSNAFLARWTDGGRKMQYDVYGWEDEEYLLPLTLYDYYGNTDVLRQKYPVIKELITRRESQVTDASGLPTNTDKSPYNDQLAIENVPADFYASVYHTVMYRDATRIAGILGYTADEETYSARYRTLRAAFNARYYLASEHDYAPHNQSAICLAVGFGLAEESELEGLAATLHGYVVSHQYHQTTGFMASEYLYGILCDYGYEEDAWKVMTQTTYPSLLGILATGATTMTERWDGQTPHTFASSNHYAFGCFARWYFEYLGGLKITSPGMRTLTVKPYFFKELGDIRVTHTTSYGLVESAWRYDANSDTFAYTLTIPEGVTATLALPNGVTRTVSGETVRYTVPA